jgi:hypothetical protein
MLRRLYSAGGSPGTRTLNPLIKSRLYLFHINATPDNASLFYGVIVAHMTLRWYYVFLLGTLRRNER